MVNQEHIKLLYEVIDKSAELYKTHSGLSYLEGIVRASENIAADDIFENDESLFNLISELKSLLSGIDFQKEEIRKAFQIAILKSLKDADKPLEKMTPEVIGVFIAYLVNRFFEGKDKIVIFDPLVGTGNLLATIANACDFESSLFGVDNDSESLMLCRSLMGMLEYEDEFYFQDTLTFSGLQADIVIADIDRAKEGQNGYFPYELLQHHSLNLKPGGMAFVVIFDDFFQEELRQDFKEKILSYYNAVGLIKLPDEMFKKYKKSILMLEKQDAKPSKQDFLVATIPSFEDMEAMQDIISRINNWFDGRIRKDK